MESFWLWIFQHRMAQRSVLWCCIKLFVGAKVYLSNRSYIAEGNLIRKPVTRSSKHTNVVTYRDRLKLQKRKLFTRASVKTIKFKVSCLLFAEGTETRFDASRREYQLDALETFTLFISSQIFPAGCFFAISVTCNRIWQILISKEWNQFFVVSFAFNSNRLMNDWNGILSQFHILSFLINVSARFSSSVFRCNANDLRR